MSRRAAELAEVALGYIAAEKAEVLTALYAEPSACLLCDLCRTKGACELSLTIKKLCILCDSVCG